jgi:hypothetical protein
LAAAILLGAAGTLRAAEDVLRLVPREALAFVVVQHLGDTDAKLQKLLQQAHAPIGNPLGIAKAMSGVSKGLDETRSAIFLALSAGEADGMPMAALVAVVPVTDYRQFLDQFHPDKPEEKIAEITVMGKTFLVAKRGHYAILTDTGHRAAVETMLDFKESIDADLADLRPWLAENELAAVAAPGVIKFVCDRQLAMVRHLKELAPRMSSERDRTFLIEQQEYREKTATAVEDGIRMIAVGGHVDSGGNVVLTGRVQLSPDRAIDRALAGVKPSPTKVLTGLPGGPFLLAFGCALPGTMMQPYFESQRAWFHRVALFAGLTDEQFNRWFELIYRPYQWYRGMAATMAPGQGLLGEMVSLLRVDDADEFLANREKQIKELQKLREETKGVLISKMECERIRLGGTPALHIHITPTQSPRAPDGNATQNQDTLLPGNGIDSYSAAVDRHRVVEATTEESLQRALKAAKKPAGGLAAMPEVVKTAAFLPAAAQAVVYVSPNWIIGIVNRQAPKVLPPGTPWKELPPLETAAPIGAAVKIMPHEVQATLVVPAAVFPAAGQ